MPKDINQHIRRVIKLAISKWEKYRNKTVGMLMLLQIYKKNKHRLLCTENVFLSLYAYLPSVYCEKEEWWTVYVPKPPSQVSAGISVSGRNSTFGTVFTSRPSRDRDLVTMVEAGPTRLHQDVKTGVGSLSRGAGVEPNSPDRSVRPTLQFGSEYIFITGNFVKRLIAYLGYLGKFGQTAEARMWLCTTTASSKTTGFLSGKRAN